jgi:hypothetical protein
MSSWVSSGWRARTYRRGVSLLQRMWSSVRWLGTPHLSKFRGRGFMARSAIVSWPASILREPSRPATAGPSVIDPTRDELVAKSVPCTDTGRTTTRRSAHRLVGLP